VQILLLIAGLVLELAGKDWFSGAGTVGWVCLGVLQIFVFRNAKRIIDSVERRLL
jgi:hypothetical protein